MKKNKLRVILLTLLTISSAAILAPQIAWAQQCNIEVDQCVPNEIDSDGDYNGSSLCKVGSCSQKVVSVNNILQANGVLEGPEQCDDGRSQNSDKSFCNGNFFRANDSRSIDSQYKPDCKNGVIDPGEKCDSLEQGVCSSCKAEPPEKFQNRTCFKTTLCGNGIVDGVVGEQCDDGNREDGDGCSSTCTTEKTDIYKMIFQVPRFSLTEDSILFWEYDDTSPIDADNVNIMDGNKDGNKVKKFTSQMGGGTAYGSPPISPLSPTHRKVVVTDRGQVVTIQHDPGKQHSGVLLSNRTYDFEKNPNDVVDFHVVFSVPTVVGETKSWDDDAFGFVFGANPGDATTNTDADYWMLNWRSIRENANKVKIPTNYTFVKPKGRASRCTKPTYGGGENGQNIGLNLFQIKGIPEWNELWQMEGCGTDIIQKIETHYDAHKPVWNLISNPLYNLGSYYLWQKNPWQLLNEDQPHRSQMRVKLTKDFFKVWVNSFLTIHIERENFPAKYNWPNKGQWGFFFIGMDNLKADFRSYNAQVNQYADYFELSKREGTTLEPETIQCNVCGDGYLYDEEQCDDGNTIDGDGCSKDCKFEAGYACTKPAEGGRTKCIQAAITSPTKDSSVKVDDLDISGTYDGPKPHGVTVTVYDNDGNKVCSGEGTITNDKKWSFDKDNCKDSDGNTATFSGNNEYKIEAAFSTDENTKDEDKFVTSVGPVSIDATTGGGTNNNPGGGTNNNPGGGTNNNPGDNKPIDVGGGTITPIKPFVVHIDYTGEPGTDITVTFEDKNGKKKVVHGKFDANGKFERDVVLKDDKGEPLTNPFTITVKTTQNGSDKTEINENVDLLYNMDGSLAAGGCGGCSSTDTSSGGFIALLLAALGLVGIRRRSSRTEEDVA